MRSKRPIAIMAALALAAGSSAAVAGTRAGDAPIFYAPQVILQSGLQRAPAGEDAAVLGGIPIWQVVGGISFFALIGLALGGGSSKNGGGYQSNGAN
ncbi:hypothetical protein AMC99_00163 [Altererythrobacter epoxidivorans]|uniref:Uncharacterized protein n=1 Tax=Altererythrobacter epoxidivorans TaxID=361183 RepID=A0A0M4LSG3_9SPHN|nr:hypothetical protein [Altererythrobacter epoxidivorans]ALE15479.1 hypothetical protein AMC99_00163 [Altererythrobacter epoxidivorans]